MDRKHRMIVGGWKEEGGTAVALHSSCSARSQDTTHQLKDVTYD
jgi:hypothetical protein